MFNQVRVVVRLGSGPLVLLLALLSSAICYFLSAFHVHSKYFHSCSYNIFESMPPPTNLKMIDRLLKDQQSIRKIQTLVLKPDLQHSAVRADGSSLKLADLQ